LPTSSFAGEAESGQEPVVITIIEKDALPSIYPRHHVIGGAVALDPNLARQGKKFSPAG